MDPRRLLTFRTVAHERSFSRAARSLSISQPSVSHQIKLLETEVGVRLLDRSRGGLRLTPAGEVLLDHADDIAWRLTLADTQITQLSDEHRRHIRLGAFPTALAHLVPSAIARLQATHGDLQFQLSELTSDELRPRLLGGEVDVALAYQDSAAQRREVTGTERVDLLQETFLVAMHPERAEAGSTEPVSLADLADEDWIVPSTDGFLVQACRDAGYEPRIVAVTADPLATRGLVVRGLGIGWVPSLLRSEYAAAVLRPVADNIRRRDIYALLPPGNRHPLARSLIRAMIDAAQEDEISRRPTPVAATTS